MDRVVYTNALLLMHMGFENTKCPIKIKYNQNNIKAKTLHNFKDGVIDMQFKYNKV